jgi:carboxypeptidase family protein
MVTQKKYETDSFENAEGKYDLTGTLTDDDGNPIPQVDLAIKCEDDGSEYSATTDSDGKFLVENVGPGKYTVRVDSDDYEKTSEEHQVGDSSNEDSDSGSGSTNSDDESTESSNESGTDEESTDASSDNDQAEDSNTDEGDDLNNDIAAG